MRGSIQNRSKGSWRIRYDGPADTNGNRKQESETVRGTRKEAESVLRERITAVENGGYAPKYDQTVTEFMQTWMQTYVKTNTTPRTQQGYLGSIRRYIEPNLGHIKLQALRPEQIQGLYSKLLEQGLSGRTVLHVHRVFRQALKHAVRWNMVIRNPTDAVIPPRPESKPVEMWDVPLIHRFIEASKASHYADLFLLGVLTGMRRSELCGLRWENVNLATGRLMVLVTLQRITGNGLVEGQPKTQKSRRSIALSVSAIDLLHIVRGNQIEHRARVEPAWMDAGYVFTKADGRPVDPDEVTHAFKKIVDDSGLPHLTLHGLRHAHATLLLASGVHLKIVSERLGHSTITTTADIYSHVLPGMQEIAANAIDDQLGGRVGERS